MHVLVTGGQGYIGSHLTQELLNQGYFVTTLDSGFNRCEFELNNNKNRLKRIEASINNPDAVIRAMDHVDAIIHLAARMDHNPSYRHPIRMINCNVEGTASVFSMAKRAGIQTVIFASSAAIYGNLINATEDSPPNPLNMYGCSKLAAEAVCRGFYQDGMDVVILRLFNVWGKRNSRSVISKFLNGCSTIYGDGCQTRDFVYIEDVVKAFISALRWESGIYNIGSGEEVEINALWKKLRDDNPIYQEHPLGYQETFRICSDQTYTLNSTKWASQVKVSELSKEEMLDL